MTPPDQTHNVQTRGHGYKQLFVCLTVLAISAPACESDLHEQAALMDQSTDAASPFAVDVGKDEGLSEAQGLHDEAVLISHDPYIQDTSTSGPGCPPGSTNVSLGPGGNNLLVTFSDMNVSYPSFITNTNCVTAVKLHVPQGRQFSLTTIEARGYASLDVGLKARTTIHCAVGDDPVGHTTHRLITGPYDSHYKFTDHIPPPSVVWSPCGASATTTCSTSIDINAIFNPNGSGVFTHDSELFRLRWRQC